MLRTQLIFSYPLTLVVWLNTYRDYNFQLMTAAPPFYYDGAIIYTRDANHSVSNLTTCNGLWSCAKASCDVYTATDSTLNIVPFGDYDSNSCKNWGTLDMVPAYDALLRYGVLYTLLGIILLMVINVFLTIFIWPSLPSSLHNTEGYFSLTHNTNGFRVLLVIYCVIFLSIKLLMLSSIVCLIVFMHKFAEISGENVSTRFNNTEMAVNIISSLITIVETLWTLSKFTIVMLIHNY